MKKTIRSIALLVIIFSTGISSAQEDVDPNYYDDRYKMSEAVTEMGLSDDDERRLIEHVADDGGRMTANSIAGSSVSDDGYDQLVDDAQLDLEDE